ncbi:hypothetical protein [Dactylosporangium sp. NPDC051541]|uniref:hypothetical protein n=1 Tax=Dactylosporangium sp. NPDC051541 TaxID=3363977 RepID=UPI0037A9ABA9
MTRPATTQPSDDAASPDPAYGSAVWRLDEHPYSADADDGFIDRLTRRLLQVYTTRGDTIVDFDDDPTLQRAAIATGRGYCAITTGADIATLDAITDQVSLIAVRWPRHPSPDSAAVADLFQACRYLATGHDAVIVVINPVPAADNGDAPAAELTAQHRHELLIAADAAGLAYLQHLAAVRTPGDPDTFQYLPPRVEQPEPSPWGELLVFGPLDDR